MGTDHIDLYYLHSPDPEIPIAESAGALGELCQMGKIRSVGVSNATVEQLDQFHEVCEVSAVQLPYNMLQRQIEETIVPWCQQRQVSIFVYWPLMKGLLAGKLPRDHQFDPRDGRAKYPMFHGEEWEKNQDFLDELRTIARDNDITVSQLVICWTYSQAGITSALCGANGNTKPFENAEALTVSLSATTLERIEIAIQERGTALTGRAIP